MADIVNLRQARKRRERTEKERAAAENRVAFGRPKADRDLAKARADKAVRDLEGHKLDTKD